MPDEASTSKSTDPNGANTSLGSESEGSADSDSDNGVLELRQRLTVAEDKIDILNTRMARELGHSRRKNILLFQLPKQNGETPRNPGIIKNYVCNFINDNIVKAAGWCTDKVKNIFRMNVKINPGPVVCRFNSVEHAHPVLSLCKNLSAINAKRKQDGGRPIAVRRHLDAKSNAESKYLGEIMRKLRTLPNYKDKNVQVMESVDPSLLVDGKYYTISQLPKDFVDMVGPYQGF